MRRILTYGTYDLLHWGHIRLLKRAKERGDYLVVAVSTDEFNWESKKKKSYHDFATRKKMLEAVRYVDLVIPEERWDQKISDIKKYEIDEVVMGDDWKGNEHFEALRDYCEVTYLPRTEGVSTTKIKHDLGLGVFPKTDDKLDKTKDSLKDAIMNMEQAKDYYDDSLKGLKKITKALEKEKAE